MCGSAHITGAPHRLRQNILLDRVDLTLYGDKFLLYRNDSRDGGEPVWTPSTSRSSPCSSGRDLSIAAIGEKVGLSQTPCWKRIQRLEADGVIDRRVAVLDPVKLGLGLTVFVSIETADHSQEWLQRFAETVSAMPEVLEFYRMAGDVDYMLRVVVADMQAYDTFYKRLIAVLPLKNVTSRFAMEKVKSTTALPLPAPPKTSRHLPELAPALAAVGE